MTQPTSDVIAELAIIARQFPRIVEFLDGWRERELQQLPYTGSSVAVAQGRCQVLAELVKLITTSPDMIGRAQHPLQPPSKRTPIGA